MKSKCSQIFFFVKNFDSIAFDKTTFRISIRSIHREMFIYIFTSFFRCCYQCLLYVVNCVKNKKKKIKLQTKLDTTFKLSYRIKGHQHTKLNSSIYTKNNAQTNTNNYDLDFIRKQRKRNNSMKTKGTEYILKSVIILNETTHNKQIPNVR